MNVIHVVPQPDGGGAERLVRELTQRLPSYGVETSAIYFRNPRHIALTHQEFDLGLSNARDPRAMLRLRRAVRERLTDGVTTLLHAHLTWPLYFVPVGLMGLGVPLVYTEHSTHNKRRHWRVLQPFERRVYGRYSRVVCISQGTQVALRQWLKCGTLDEEITIIPNGSRLLPYVERAARPQGPVSLVSVGSLTPQKGLDLALHAVARLGDAIGRYTIVGEGGERLKLETLARELGIAQKVRLPGYVDDVTPYLHEADLALIPSRWEGFGLAAVEALSTGLPLVAFDVDGLREVISSCRAAHLVPSGDVKALAEGIQFAQKHLIRRREVEEQALRCAQAHGINDMVERYADLYKQLVLKKVNC